MDAVKYTKEEEEAIILAVKSHFGFSSPAAQKKLLWSLTPFAASFFSGGFFWLGLASFFVVTLIIHQKFLEECAKRGVSPKANVEHGHLGGSAITSSNWQEDSYRPFSSSSRYFHADTMSTPRWDK